MNARRVTIAAALAVTAAGAVLAKVGDRQAAQAIDPGALERDSVAYERILVDDPAVVAELRTLYAEDRELQASTRARLDAMREAIAAETSYAARRALIEEASQLKRAMEVGHIEIGLRIAELNEDARRAADFALALDQIRDPEKYAPPRLDPSIQIERRRRSAR